MCLHPQLDIENEVNNEMANRMSLFYAEATPMLKTLSNATTNFVTEVRNPPSKSGLLRVLKSCHTVIILLRVQYCLLHILIFSTFYILFKCQNLDHNYPTNKKSSVCS